MERERERERGRERELSGRREQRGVAWCVRSVPPPTSTRARALEWHGQNVCWERHLEARGGLQAVPAEVEALEGVAEALEVLNLGDLILRQVQHRQLPRLAAADLS